MEQGPAADSRKIVIGLGSNLGDRQANIDGALAALSALARASILARSGIWETEPIGGPPQPNFYNAAVALQFDGNPADLLDALLAIEKRFGRERSTANAPRTLDLDILWIQEHTINLPRLQVPHPRLHERAFALAPLLEVAPEATDPITLVPYAKILRDLGSTGIRRLRAPLDA